MTPASPAVTKAVDSYLYRLCIDEGFHDVVSEYGLEPFELLANSIERTFVDKIFALCDYYLAGPIPPRQSRHIYDLNKLSSVVSFDETDYENVTAHLLFEAVPYEAAARSILLIAEFARTISVH